MSDILDQVLHKRMMKRWARIARDADALDLENLRAIRGRAREIRRRLDRVLFVADGRLTLPLIGSNAIQRPLGCDWAYRPEIWRGPITPVGAVAVDSRTPVGDEAQVYHDCERSELTYRQIRNNRAEDIAPFGFRMDVFRFDGSFLSLAIDLPAEAADGLTRRHIIRFSTAVELEKPLEIYARLNIRHGPNTEQMVRQLDLSEDELTVEFDLAYAKISEKRVEKLWLDIIFEGPEMNQIILRDVTLSRRPRAEI